MKYITLFEQQTAFDNAKSTLDKPNMSLVTETGNVYSLAVGGGGMMPTDIPMLTLVFQAA